MRRGCLALARSLAPSNDFHISSESYGGHYMPQLAEEILKRNDQVRVDKSAPVINLAGFLVGNPFTDASSNQVRSVSPLLNADAIHRPVFLGASNKAYFGLNMLVVV